MSNKPISDRSCETIVALASGALPSGIAVVRVSGATERLVIKTAV